jgi:hypothetical protein
MWDDYLSDYNNQVSCIDRQIAYLQYKKAALQSGSCFLGYDTIHETYVEEEDNYERDSNETEYHNT